MRPTRVLGEQVGEVAERKRAAGADMVPLSMRALSLLACALAACAPPESESLFEPGTLDEASSTVWVGTADAYGHEGLIATVTLTPYLEPPPPTRDFSHDLHDTFQPWGTVRIDVELPAFEPDILATGVWEGQLGARVKVGELELLALTRPLGGTCMDALPPHEGSPHADYRLTMVGDGLELQSHFSILTCAPPGPITVFR